MELSRVGRKLQQQTEKHKTESMTGANYMSKLSRKLGRPRLPKLAKVESSPSPTSEDLEYIDAALSKPSKEIVIEMYTPPKQRLKTDKLILDDDSDDDDDLWVDDRYKAMMINNKRIKIEQAKSKHTSLENNCYNDSVPAEPIAAPNCQGRPKANMKSPNESHVPPLVTNSPVNQSDSQTSDTSYENQEQTQLDSSQESLSSSNHSVTHEVITISSSSDNISSVVVVSSSSLTSKNSGDSIIFIPNSQQSIRSSILSDSSSDNHSPDFFDN